MNYDIAKNEFERLKNLFPKLKDWHLSINKTKSSFGRCNYTKKEIQVSIYHLSSPKDEIIDTIRHEVAHALAGYKVKHGAAWKKIAKQIGARPQSSSSADLDVPYKYEYKCSCGRTHKHHRISKRATYRCNKTGEVIKWKQNF